MVESFVMRRPLRWGKECALIRAKREAVSAPLDKSQAPENLGWSTRAGCRATREASASIGITVLSVLDYRGRSHDGY
jgi:hypothetical protein